MKHPILVIAVSLALLSFEVDCVDTISDKKKNEGEAEDYFSAKVKERRLNSDSNPKLVIAGLGDVGVGHGHGHNHHPNKVSNTTLKIIIRRRNIYRKNYGIQENVQNIKDTLFRQKSMQSSIQ